MRTSVKAKFEGIVQPWGNSLGLRITRAISDMANLGKGDEVSIEVTEKGLLISRKKPMKRIKLPYSEADLLAGMTCHMAHADELPSLLAHEVGG
jgi:antitoxin MazE